VLDNLSFINRSLVDQEDELNTFLTSTTGFTSEMGDFLTENEQRIITLAADSLPSLLVFERYAPQYPCLLDAITRQNELGNDTLGGLQPGLHITLEITRNGGGYRDGDQPRFGEDAGPTCFGLIGEPIVPFPITVEVTDGYCDEHEQSNPGVQTECPGRAGGGPPQPPANPIPVPAQEQERALVRAAVGPVLGVPATEVPDLATLLFGPVARGATITLD
jgi:hypothetical protein